MAYHLEGIDNEFEIRGHAEYEGVLNGPNSLKGWKNGKTEITFNDGGRYTYTEPTMIIKEIL
jgi:hypothetical protein